MTFDCIFDALSQGATVITPTNRLQREILWLYTQRHHQAIFAKPSCFSYENWLAHWYQTHLFNHPYQTGPTLIDAWQFECIWKHFCQQLLGKTPQPFELQQALTAVKNCALTLQPPIGSDFLYTPIASEFQSVWLAVDQHLADQNLLPPHALANHLTNLPFYQTHAIGHVIWVCFDVLHPVQQRLQQHLQQLGVRQSYFDINSHQLFSSAEETKRCLFQPPSHPVYVHQAHQDDDELYQILAWIEHQRQQDKRRIGVVVPDLSQQKANLKRFFKQHLPNEQISYSLGEPLTTYPVIKHALALLEINPSKRLTREQCRILLHSPFISCPQHEQTKRHQLLQTDKIFQEPEVPFKTFIQHCEKTCPQWSQSLQQLTLLPEAATIPEWVKNVHLRWQQLGFPGASTMHEALQSLLNKLYLCLENLHLGQAFVTRLNQPQWIQEFTSVCQNHIHQPPQNYDGIHIMGWFESSGFCGDALWICHFQSQFIPQPLSFSNMLPIYWQKQHHFPRTNSQKEFEIAHQVLHRLIQGQKQVVISYAEHSQQQPQWPSPLLPHSLIKYQTLPRTASPILELEVYQQHYDIPVSEDEQIRGGSHLLSLQAQCPFRAFAKFRLHTERPLLEHHGLESSERGQLVHETLQRIWSTLQNQQQLHRCSVEELNHLIAESIQHCLQPLFINKPYSMDNISQDLEHEYLQQQVEQALELDKQRPAFRIHSLEQSLELNIDGWPFKLRYDRMDELDTGQYVLIDYKTSIPSPLPWHKERPIHPQILMYALANSTIQGLMYLAFGKDFRINGISAQELQIDGVKQTKHNWTSLQQHWLAELRELITEIRQGHCQPTPQASMCKTCDYQSLCRVKQLEIEQDNE
jgi:ATP-dependent helicase/nuclease subunit B